MPAPARRPSPASAEQIERARAIRRLVLNLSLAVVLIASIAWTVGYLRTTVAQTVASGGPPRVSFTQRPAWMSDYLADELADICRPEGNPSVFDRDALAAISERLRANPWIEKVRQVRRVYGESAGDTIEVDCDFRAPAALVQGGKASYWFVDARGVRLPEQFGSADIPKVIYARDGRLNLRVIEGVKNLPPGKAGQLWTGDDLAAGLEMAQKLNGQAFADEIERIDVANYGGRIERGEAQLVLRTKRQTEIRWGRPWNAMDAFVEIKPDVKFATLQKMAKRYGRVDAGQPWIDIRFETIMIPPVATTQANER